MTCRFRRVRDRSYVARLTPKEEEVKILLLKGYKNALIASTLGIKEKSARYHISSIYAFYNVKSRAEFMALYLRETVCSEVSQPS